MDKFAWPTMGLTGRCVGVFQKYTNIHVSNPIGGQCIVPQVDIHCNKEYKKLDYMLMFVNQVNSERAHLRISFLYKLSVCVL